MQDPEAAEDLTQDALLVALRRPPRAAGSMRVWLARVTRNLAFNRRRGEERRRGREIDSAREERLPSSSTLVEQVEIERLVAKEVLRLPEPYRTTLLLRFHEEVTPQELARDQGVPAGTVRSRLKRGLDLLRERLDAKSGGDRRAWLQALAPLVPEWSTPTALVGGGFVMKKLVLALSLVVVGLGLFATWKLVASPPLGGTELSQDVELVTADRVEDSTTEELASGTTEEVSTRAPFDSRTAVAPSPAKPGSIAGRLTWKLDDTPAVGIALFLHDPPDGAGSRMPRTYVTDENGEFEMSGLVAGTYEVESDRTWGSRSVVVEAGTQHRIDLELVDAVDVVGTVHDWTGNPVADAEIVLRKEEEGLVLGRSDERGRFKVRLLRIFNWLGARKAGYLPSPLVAARPHVNRAPEDFVLVLSGAGGTLTGIVLNPRRQPVPNAIVVVSSRHAMGHDSNWLQGTDLPPHHRTETDASGTYRLEGLSTGWVQTTAYAPGFAPANYEVKLGSVEVVEHEFLLSEGVTVRGRVIDPESRPLAGIEVSIADHRSLVSREPKAITGEDGTFRIEALPPGPLPIRTGNRIGVGSFPYVDTSALLTGAEGEEVEWNVALKLRGEIRGRLIDDTGAPLVDWPVNPYPSTPVGLCRTDRDGRFVIAGCEDREYRIQVFPRQKWRSETNGADAVADPRLARPGVEEVTFTVRAPTLPSAFVTGILVDGDGTPLGGQTVVVTGSGRASTESKTGRFEVGPLAAGEHRIVRSLQQMINAHQSSSPLASFVVEEGQTLDLGEIKAPATGSVLVRILPPRDHDLRQATVEIRREDAPDVRHASFDVSGDLESPRVKLPLGRYFLSVRGAGVAGERIPFTVEADHTTLLDVPVHAGATVRLRVVDSKAKEVTDKFVLTVFDASGNPLLYENHRWTTALDDGSRELRLAAGTYEIEARTETGRTGRGRVRLARGTEFPGCLVIRLDD